jgi:hypothetical protein
MSFFVSVLFKCSFMVCILYSMAEYGKNAKTQNNSFYIS